MRVLVLNWRDLAHPHAGGAEVYTAAVTREWLSLGHDVTHFSAEVEGQPPDEVVDGVRIIRRGSRFSVYREARRFYENEGQGKFDLVVDEINTHPFMTPAFVKDVPIVALIHQVCREIWWHEVPFPVAMLGRFVFEPYWLRAYRDIPTVTLSASSKESLERYGLRDIQVIPVGVSGGAADVVGPKEAQPTLLYVGRLSKNKRPDHVVKAYQLARRRNRELRLWIVGEGPMEAALRKRVGNDAVFFGRVDNSTRSELMARAQRLLMASVREGWGMTVTEAAAVGTRTIAYASPGLVDSVAAAGGRLCAPNPQALAAAILDDLAANVTYRVHPSPLPSWRQVAEALLNRVASTASAVHRRPQTR